MTERSTALLSEMPPLPDGGLDWKIQQFTPHGRYLAPVGVATYWHAISPYTALFRAVLGDSLRLPLNLPISSVVSVATDGSEYWFTSTEVLQVRVIAHDLAFALQG